MTAASIYRERPVDRRLAPWAACLWVRRAPVGHGSDAAPALVVPDGCVDLLWADDGLSVVGPDTGPRPARLGAGGVTAGLRLRPGAAALLLGDLPASALLDVRVPLTELWPQAAAEQLAEQLAERPADGWRAAALLQRAVSGRLPGLATDPAALDLVVPDPMVLRVVAALDRPRPPSVRALAAQIGLSERQLRRRMLAAVGYGPKTLQSVLRFQRVRAASREGAQVNWAALANRAGYADQAHLAREVRRWSGRPPTGLSAGPAAGPEPVG